MPAFKPKTAFTEDLTLFADWLREARKRRGLTQTELSEMSGVDQGLISKYERAALSCPKQTVYALAYALSQEDADERTGRALLNSGLKAAGYAPIPDELTVELDPDALALAEGYSGLPDYARQIVDSAYKSASKLALEMDRESSIGKRAE